MIYERIPTRIEAVQWDGGDITTDIEQTLVAMGAEFTVEVFTGTMRLLAGKAGAQGHVDVPVGHWVAKADDHFYPIAPDVFAAIYRQVDQ